MIAGVPDSRDKDSTAPSVPPRVLPPSAEQLKQGVVQALCHRFPPHVGPHESVKHNTKILNITPISRQIARL